MDDGERSVGTAGFALFEITLYARHLGRDVGEAHHRPGARAGEREERGGLHIDRRA